MFIVTMSWVLYLLQPEKRGKRRRRRTWRQLYISTNGFHFQQNLSIIGLEYFYKFIFNWKISKYLVIVQKMRDLQLTVWMVLNYIPKYLVIREGSKEDKLKGEEDLIYILNFSSLPQRKGFTLAISLAFHFLFVWHRQIESVSFRLRPISNIY